MMGWDTVGIQTLAGRIFFKFLYYIILLLFHIYVYNIGLLLFNLWVNIDIPEWVDQSNYIQWFLRNFLLFLLMVKYGTFILILWMMRNNYFNILFFIIRFGKGQFSSIYTIVQGSTPFNHWHSLRYYNFIIFYSLYF